MDPDKNHHHQRVKQDSGILFPSLPPLTKLKYLLQCDSIFFPFSRDPKIFHSPVGSVVLL